MVIMILRIAVAVAMIIMENNIGSIHSDDIHHHMVMMIVVEAIAGIFWEQLKKQRTPGGESENSLDFRGGYSPYMTIKYQPALGRIRKPKRVLKHGNHETTIL